MKTRWYVSWGGLGVLFLLFLTACLPAPVPSPTPTPTRTPHPTATPLPTATPTPVPTPTPAFPVTVSCAADVPASACAVLRARVAARPDYFTWIEAPEAAQVLLRVGVDSQAFQQGRWTFAVAAPFFTLDEALTLDELHAAWKGTPNAPWATRPLLLTEDTARALRGLLGEPAPHAYTLVAAETLLAEAEARNGWTLLPFELLAPQWKVLRVDGISLLEKTPAVNDYPLVIPLVLESPSRPEALPLLELHPTAFVNRDEGAMTIVIMTGVTAMDRGFARLVERTDLLYPVKDVRAWFEDADFVHISNEISFKPDCTPAPSFTTSFCSPDSYIEILEALRTNIIELTGNHLGDKGREWIPYTLELYRQRGWQWYGGGANLTEATRPLTLTHNGNRIAFLGCNPSVGFYASETLPGAAPCTEAWQREQMQDQIRALRAEGYLPIMTVQHVEVDQYYPDPRHLRDLRAFAEAGAVIVQGSQAHWVMPMEFYGESFIHYGPGNFLFDQMWDIAVRQGFVTRYTFYAGRLLSIDLRPTLIEEFGRPRPMTPEERREFLQKMFGWSPQFR